MSIEHRKNDKLFSKLNFSIIIISDSRYKELVEKKPPSDLTTPIIREILSNYGHNIVSTEIIPDEPDFIIKKIDKIISEFHPHIIITSGGTGITKRDITIEALQNVYEKIIPGFGELFRYLSYKEIGPLAILSRATAGVYRDTLIFNLPGSPNAVKLALEKIIIPIAPHSLAMLR